MRFRRVLAVLVLALACSAPVVLRADDQDVSGPVVKLSDVQVSGASTAANNATARSPPSEADQSNAIQDLAAAVSETAKEVAREVDKTLIKEFGNGTSTESKGESFAAALQGGAQGSAGDAQETGKLETVVRISGTNSMNTGGAAAGAADTESRTANGTNGETPEASAAASTLDASIEKKVDRIIDQHDNEFVLSRPGSDVAVLTLDPQLVTDLTVVLVAAAALGAVFEGLGQPTINGYLIAGAMVGPGGLQLVEELVQVESIAQLGVYLLLFGLGMELNLAKVRSVLGVSIIGGSFQIILAMVAGGAISAWMCDSPVTPGVFTGALLAMSSTSVVVKCLEATRSMHTAYGTITVGTLILQDIWVGLLFALMPIFKPQAPMAIAAISSSAPGMAVVAAGSAVPPEVAASAATEAAALAAGEDGGALLLGMEAALAAGAAGASGLGMDQAALVLEAILKVLLRIALFGGLSLLLARVVLSRPLRLLVRHGSAELNQMVLVGICLACTWAGGRAGISEELGAFLGGVMVSSAGAAAAALSGPPLVLASQGRRHGAGAGAGVSGGGAAPSGDAGAGAATTGYGAAAAHSTYSRHHVPPNGTGAAAPGAGGTTAGVKGDSLAGTGLGAMSVGEALEAGLGVPLLGGGGVGAKVERANEVARLAEELQHALRHNIDSVHNVLTALFIACTSIIISPRFLLQHVRVLAIGTALVMTVKTLLVAGTVSWFGHSWRLSLAIGVTMSHVGEFAFVLLSASVHLNILPPQVYQLLLGVTALSLLATPLVIMLCSRLLREPLSINTMGPRIPLMSDASSSPEAVQKNSARLALGKD